MRHLNYNNEVLILFLVGKRGYPPLKNLIMITYNLFIDNLLVIKEILLTVVFNHCLVALAEKGGLLKFVPRLMSLKVVAKILKL